MPNQNSGSGPASPPPLKLDVLRQVASTFRKLHGRLLRLAAQIECQSEAQRSLKRHGAQGAQLVRLAAEAGAGPPFTTFGITPPDGWSPLKPPTDVDTEVWWLQWRVLASSASIMFRPLLPHAFGRPTVQMGKAGEHVTWFQMAESVADPIPVWRDRVEDHAELCSVLAGELEEQAGRFSDDGDPKPLEGRVLGEVFDGLEELLIGRKRQRAFMARVDQAVSFRDAWIIERWFPAWEACERRLTGSPLAGRFGRSCLPIEPASLGDVRGSAAQRAPLP